MVLYHGTEIFQCFIYIRLFFKKKEPHTSSTVIYKCDRPVISTKIIDNTWSTYIALNSEKSNITSFSRGRKGKVCLENSETSHLRVSKEIFET